VSRKNAKPRLQNFDGSEVVSVGCSSKVAADSPLVLDLCVQQASTVRNELACQLAHKGIRPLRQLDVA
jgi:hypothetical protein